jgi:hypothetical protein
MDRFLVQPSGYTPPSEAATPSYSRATRTRKTRKPVEPTAQRPHTAPPPPAPKARSVRAPKPPPTPPPPRKRPSGSPYPEGSYYDRSDRLRSARGNFVCLDCAAVGISKVATHGFVRGSPVACGPHKAATMKDVWHHECECGRLALYGPAAIPGERKRLTHCGDCREIDHVNNHHSRCVSCGRKRRKCDVQSSFHPPMTETGKKPRGRYCAECAVERQAEALACDLRAETPIEPGEYSLASSARTGSPPAGGRAGGAPSTPTSPLSRCGEPREGGLEAAL